MTAVYLKLNNETGRYDCYSVMEDEYLQTLTCGNPFIYAPDDEDEEFPGRIEHSKDVGYYWIDAEDFCSQKLFNRMRGFI